MEQQKGMIIKMVNLYFNFADSNKDDKLAISIVSCWL